MNYHEAVRFLYSLGNELKAGKYDLARIRVLLAALGNPHLNGRFVHVAGTNGKGSTCAMIESGLRAAGFRTGLYTSPHLAEPTERIQISGQPITREAFAATFNQVHAVAEALLAKGDLDQHPSYFETVTAMAFVFIAQTSEVVAKFGTRRRNRPRDPGKSIAWVGGAGGFACLGRLRGPNIATTSSVCDWVVLEVGLGGRLDATNVVDPKLCVITPVDFDHEAWLGRGIDSIAFEKAGILKPGVPAVITPQRPEADQVIRRRAGEVGAPLIDPRDWPIANAVSDRRGSRFDLGALHITCPLAGEHQIENARTAAVALQSIGVPNDAIEAGIAAARWPGRLELLSQNPEIIVDGAHNPAGARALAAYLDRFYAHEPLTLIYGAMRDKALEEVAGTLFPRFAEVILTAPQQPRAAAPESLLDLVDHPNIRTAPDLGAAISQVHQTTFITGSLFLVAEARQLLQ